MKEVLINKRLRWYITQLFILGWGFLIVGIVISYIIFLSISRIPQAYLPLMIFSAALGYLGVIKVDPGGAVRYYFTPHKDNEDERALYKLVIKYRNKSFITLITGLFIFISILTLGDYRKENIFSIDMLIGIFTFVIVGIVCLGNGVKYLSAWWNIKRNWKKEFGE